MDSRLCVRKETNMQITIRADKGKWLTDGVEYSKTFSLGNGVSVNDYDEITDEEYNEILESESEKIVE